MKLQKNGYDYFEKMKKIVVREIPIFKKVCMEFHFVNKPGYNRDEIMFAKQEYLFKLNLETNEINVFFKFKTPLNSQPLNFDMSLNQDIFIVASRKDALYVNLRNEKEFDIARHYRLDQIHSIIYEIPA